MIIKLSHAAAVFAVMLALPGLNAAGTTFRQQLEEHWFKQVGAGDSGNRNMRVEQDAFGAVNGDRYDGTGFHTPDEENPWWQVDLAEIFDVGRMVVCNRASCEDRIRNMEILFSVDGQSWKKVFVNDGKIFAGGNRDTQPLELKFNGEKARYIKLQIPRGFFHLNEVEVYASDDDKTNVALRKHATQSNVSPWSTRSLEKVPDEWLPMRRRSGPPLLEKDIEDAAALAERTLTYVDTAKPLPGVFKEKMREYRQMWTDGKVQPSGYDDFYIALRALRREILFAHPALDFDKILINRNPPTMYSHNGDQHLGIHSRVGPGLTILENWKKEPQATALLAGRLPAGATRNPDLHYDAQKVAFAFCDHSTGERKRYFLYEAALDGSSVRQLTGTARDTFATWQNRATVVIEDNDPCYLPDGRLVFISTRSQSYGRCHGGRYNPAWVLHTCDANGDNIRQISYGNENEYEPAVLNDGRVIFTRWEYTNRHEMLFHMLWWCRPDGTSVANYYGNDTLHPMMMVEASAIPGTHKVVCTAQGHHSYSTGTTVVLDTSRGENGEEPITRVTVETPYSETHGWPSPHYSHPCAVNDEMFLVSRANHKVHPQGNVPPPDDRAIYLVDTLGGRELIYEDPSVASFSPIIIRRRARPPVIPSVIESSRQDYATVYVENVYLTRNDPEGMIKPGMIKALRINAIGVQPRAHRTACNRDCPNEIPKRVVGTVPVGQDGSAFFKVPARTALQMQILDENGMAILTEKSFFYMQPGEHRGCVGCHEKSGSTPVSGNLSYKKLMAPEPPAGPDYPGGMSFMRTVQPVLDRYCIGCHGLGESEKTEAGKINLIHDGRMHYPRSYQALVDRGDHRVGDKGYMWGEFNISRPRRFYAYRNKVAHMIREHHGKIDMDEESYMRIIEWLDLNAQCYGDLFPNKLEERRIDGNAMKALREYAKGFLGEKFVSCEDRALINVAQPEESRILMAPLAKAAGGWQQAEKCWEKRDDPQYMKLVQLVDACIVRSPNENTNGWEPTFEQGGGEDWVRQEREKYRIRVQSEARKN